MSMYKTILAVVLFGCLSVVVVACSQEGPAEKAGERIDEAVEETGDRLQDVGENIQEKADEVKEQVNKATQNQG